MLENLIQEFVPSTYKLKPQFFERCGFEVRSFFNFGEYCDPRHQLPISIVIWRLPPTEQLKQSSHPQTDIVTYVLKGGYRLDNAIQENQQFKAGDVIQFICGLENNYHRDSNSSEDVTEIVQLFFQNIQEQRNTEQRIYKQEQIIKNEKYYETSIQNGSVEINNKEFSYLIIINLDEKALLIDQTLKLNKYECQYFIGEKTCKIDGNSYLIIKLL